VPTETPDERWLAAALPFVRERLPPAPATLVEIGCGPLGGFVPALRGSGYDAVGVDPEAPDGPAYRQTLFERADLPQKADAVVASTSLHHVASLDVVLDRVVDLLLPNGLVVVVEWAWERFDEATAQWCFSRLRPAEEGDGHDWLRGRRDDWIASGQPWESYLGAWAQSERMHRGEAILSALDARLDAEALVRGPYLFPDLDGVAAADEQAAIDAGEIQPTGIRYVGRLRSARA
jgi:SAM-dependent methyltransferase